MPIPAPTQDVCFTIVDVAYGRDDTSTTRIQRKQDTYPSLVSLLRHQGWSAHGAEYGTSSFAPPKRATAANTADEDSTTIRHASDNTSHSNGPVWPPTSSGPGGPSTPGPAGPSTSGPVWPSAAGPEGPPRTHIGVISLGIAGSVYTSTKNTLLQLGLRKAETSSLLAALSLLSINRTHELLRTRRRMDQHSEQKSLPGGGAG